LFDGSGDEWNNRANSASSRGGRFDIVKLLTNVFSQDPKEKRNIRADERLLAVFDGKKVVSMFEMTKLVNGHLV